MAGSSLTKNKEARTMMKTLLIALTLIVAAAAPVAAEGFPNPYATSGSR
jgi:hypothetical protein